MPIFSFPFLKEYVKLWPAFAIYLSELCCFAFTLAITILGVFLCKIYILGLIFS